MATDPTHGGAEACDHLRRRAQERLDAGDRRGARVLFEEVVRVAPSDAVSWRRLCELIADTDPATAAMKLAPIVADFPDSSELWNQLAIWRSAAGKTAEAAVAFRTAVGLSPDDAGLRSNLALALTRCGDPHAAIAEARQSILLDPGRPEAHANLGHALLVLQDWMTALAAFDRSLALRRQFTDAMIGRARALRGMGAVSDAIALYRRILDIDPELAAGWSDLASLAREFGVPIPTMPPTHSEMMAPTIPI